jgi:rhodanese-related sulfurtransferase
MEGVMIFNNANTIMVDVRTKEEYDEASLKDAISVPLNGIHDVLIKMSSGTIKTNDGFVCEKDYIVFCDNGKRSLEAFIIFKKHGFKVFNGGSLIKSAP